MTHVNQLGEVHVRERGGGGGGTGDKVPGRADSSLVFRLSTSFLEEQKREERRGKCYFKTRDFRASSTTTHTNLGRLKAAGC
jgi:hypothetical protein